MKYLAALAVAFSMIMAVTSAVAMDRLRYTRIVVTKSGTMISYEPTTASFTNDRSSGSPGVTVVFTDTSTGGATTWTWDFGDGGSSSEQSPSYTFTTAGTFTVTLTASNPEYSSQATTTITVTTPFIAMTSFKTNMSGGKILAKTMAFPANATVTVRFWNTGTDQQIGTNKTAGPGTSLSVAGVTVSDGVEVRIQYTATTSVGGYQNVTNWTTMGTYVMVNNSGDSQTYTPDPPQ